MIPQRHLSLHKQQLSTDKLTPIALWSGANPTHALGNAMLACDLHITNICDSSANNGTVRNCHSAMTCTDSACLPACRADVAETQLLGFVPCCPGNFCLKVYRCSTKARSDCSRAPLVASTLQVIPDELSFLFELMKVATSTRTLCNTSVNKLAYRIKPSSGFVDAGRTTGILVILQKHQGYPLDLEDCKDKHLVLWVSVQPQTHMVTSTMFVGEGIHAERLCVRFKAAADSLATTVSAKPSRWKLLSLSGLFQSTNHSAENTNLQ